MVNVGEIWGNKFDRYEILEVSAREGRVLAKNLDDGWYHVHILAENGDLLDLLHRRLSLLCPAPVDPTKTPPTSPNAVTDLVTDLGVELLRYQTLAESLAQSIEVYFNTDLGVGTESNNRGEAALDFIRGLIEESKNNQE